jgi:hypothetical protein
MSRKLPPVIAAYFAGTNAHDVEACAACFTDDASVRDEGRERNGLAEIREWKAEVIEKYRMSVDIVDGTAGDTAEKFVVTGRVTGTFPGSPVEIPFKFKLEGEKIARLEIGTA